MELLGTMLISADTVYPPNIKVGKLLSVAVVMMANVGKDVLTNIKNLVGGRAGHYENLIQVALDQAFKDLEEKAKDQGYDGVIGVKIANPVVVEGGVEIIVYGNGFNRVSQDDEPVSR